MTAAEAPVLIVDDDREMANMIGEVLSAAGFRAITTNSGAQALEAMRTEEPDVVVSDLRMGGMNGHQLLEEIRRLAPAVPVVIITAFGSIPTAVKSVKLGAFDYLAKPFSNEELILTVERALEDRNLRREVKRLRGALAHSYGLSNIVATSHSMRDLLESVAQIADTSTNVLLIGESGTGKDLLARALHFQSRRQPGPFVPVNCAAIPETLLESELFGYVRGAFTDARMSKSGLFQAADKGTLFLDEIGEMPTLLQAKLLRVLESKRIRPIGATTETPVDVRIVAATNSDLEKAIAADKFRADLYYRLATVVLTIPPLRDRPEDIPALVQHFLARASAEAGRSVPDLEPEVVQKLQTYSWPGNIRELHSAVQRAVIFCRGDTITIRDLPPGLVGERPSAINFEDAAARRMTLDQVERDYARTVLALVGGNKSDAAAILGIDRKTLYRKLETNSE